MNQVVIVVVTGLLLSVPSSGYTDELDDLAALWSIADEPYRPVTRTLETTAFQHHKVLSITPASLDDGWVPNHQCHRYFPLFPALQISFREGTVRNMHIIEYSNVEHAVVQEPTIQMKSTRPESALCFTSENNTLAYDDVHKEYRLTVGPYYLKLFDGYFPLDVDLKIEYPHQTLRYAGMEPTAVEGARIDIETGRIHFEALFEGKLKLIFKFE